MGFETSSEHVTFTNVITNIIEGLLDVSDSEDFYSFFDDLLSELVILLTPILLIGLIVSIMGCLLGSEYPKIFKAVCGLNLGFDIGFIVSFKITIDDRNINALYYGIIFGAIAGIVLLICSCRYNKVGVFIIAFVTTAHFAYWVIQMIWWNTTASLIIGVILGTVLGIAAIYFTKPVIMLTTAVSYGLSAGVFMSAMFVNTSSSVIYALLFIASGLIMQLFLNSKAGKKKKERISAYLNAWYQRKLEIIKND